MTAALASFTMTNADRDAIDLTPYRWWTFANNEASARQLIRQARERNAALGGPKPGLSAKAAGDIIAGHADGMRNILVALRAQGIITVTD